MVLVRLMNLPVSADGLIRVTQTLGLLAWNPALTVHPGGHRNGMYASTRIGFNMYSNEWCIRMSGERAMVVVDGQGKVDNNQSWRQSLFKYT